MKMKKLLVLLASLAAAVAIMPALAQNTASDEGGRVLAFEAAWGHAMEAKDARAINSILADKFISVDFDGSLSDKSAYLAAINAPGSGVSQAVNEQANVTVYGDAAIVVGVFRIKGMEKGKPYLRRERFIDTWIKTGQSWQCAASQVTLTAAK